MFEYFKKLFSSTNEASSKRFIAIVLALVHIVALFLLMYIPIEIKNKDLVDTCLDNNFWLIIIFGGFIVGESIVEMLKFKSNVIGKVGIAKAETRTPDVMVNNENVDNQNIPGNER